MVTMLMYLLVLACACAPGMAKEIPSYLSNLQAINRANNILTENLLSIDGNIPLLNDSRRHYAEIIHVINYLSIMRSGCVLLYPYNEEYPLRLNVSAAEAISNPQAVINDVKELLQLIHENTNELQELIVKECYVQGVNNDSDCNLDIDQNIHQNPDKFNKQVEIFLAAGAVASELNAKDALFSDASNGLTAHNFVILGVNDLENAVDALASLHRTINSVIYLQNC